MFLMRREPTLRYNMRPRQPRSVTPRIMAVLAFLFTLLIAWKIFSWIALPL